LHTPADTTSLNLTGISCASERSCLAVGSGCVAGFSCSPQGLGSLLLHTADGGRHWKAAIAPAPPSGMCQAGGCPATVSLNAASCPSTQRCWVVGASGTILRTDTGGRSWTQDSTGTDIGLRGISCPSISHCYAVGDAGTILALGS
jgi:hypothetical protein